MWYLKELEIDSLMSFADAKISFRQGEVTVIYGKNLDVGQDKSNGSGKSAILEGIGFGITGSPLRKVKIGDLVNDDAKQALVKVTLANDGLGEVMEIHRVLFKKKSSVCQVFINEVQVDNITSTDEANKFIEAKLGVLKDDLLNFFILMAAKFTPFLDASDTKKKEVINRFSNGVIVDKSIEQLTGDMVLCKEELDDIEKSSNNLRGTLEALESTLVEALSSRGDSGDEREKRILGIKAAISLCDVNTEDQTNNFSELQLDIDSINEEISELKDSKLLVEKIKLIESDQKKQSGLRIELKTQLQEHKHQMNHLKLKIEGSIECPKCDHEFDITDDKADIDEVREKYYQMDLELSDIIESGKSVREKIDTYQGKIDTLNTKVAKLDGERSELLDERSEIMEDMQNCHNAISGNRDRIKLYLMEIEVLRSKDDVDTATPLRNRIESVKTKLEPIEAKFSEITEEYDELSVQLDIFRRFKSHLANLSLKSMEGIANDFLEDFGSDIFVQLNSEKKLANNRTTEKIDSTLVRNGVDIGSFNKRSGGEKAAINLAFAKTLSHLINLNAGENKGINILVIDEILDATDAEGLTKIVSSFEKNEDTVVLISHIPLPDSVGRHLVVVKENDLSKIL